MKNRLEELRKQAGITQETLADSLEVSRQTIGSLESEDIIRPSCWHSKLPGISMYLSRRYLFTRRSIKMKSGTKQLLYILGIAAGIALVIAGIFFKDAELKGLMGVCVGVGAGLIGMFIANLVTLRIERKHPEAFIRKNIDVNDERNTVIRDKAGAKSNSIIMLAIMPILTLVFILVDTELYVILTMASLILLNIALLYRLCKLL
jgi:hypothetical protein